MNDLFLRLPSSYDNSPGLRAFAVSRGSGHAVAVERWHREQAEEKQKQKRIRRCMKFLVETGEYYAAQALAAERGFDAELDAWGCAVDRLRKKGQKVEVDLRKAP